MEEGIGFTGVVKRLVAFVCLVAAIAALFLPKYENIYIYISGVAFVVVIIQAVAMLFMGDFIKGVIFVIVSCLLSFAIGFGLLLATNILEDNIPVFIMLLAPAMFLAATTIEKFDFS